MKPGAAYEGRLVCTGDGHLYAHPDPAIDPLDDAGNVVLTRVTADPVGDRYVAIGDSEASHNDRFGRNVVQVGNGTSGPLFDENGVQVFDGDPHHLRPAETDPHYAADGGTKDRHGRPTFTRTVTLPDDVAATATGHTDAYKGAHDE